MNKSAATPRYRIALAYFTGVYFHSVPSIISISHYRGEGAMIPPNFF